MRRRKTSKRRRSRRRLQGGACPPGLPLRLCQKHEEREKRNKYSVTRNFKTNLEQSLRNRERRLMPEEYRVSELRERFNWKSRVPKFNAIRRGEGNENNISNNELLNIHSATNIDFPLPTGTPAAFDTFTGPPQLGPMRKKIYKNNNINLQ
jgi:hypothetical protein